MAWQGSAKLHAMGRRLLCEDAEEDEPARSRSGSEDGTGAGGGRADSLGTVYAINPLGSALEYRGGGERPIGCVSSGRAYAERTL